MALLEFYGTECSHCQNMEPLIERLKQEGYVIEQLECWHNDANEARRQELDKEFCGGVPFFYDTSSGHWICGETDYESLKKWAQGKHD